MKFNSILETGFHHKYLLISIEVCDGKSTSHKFEEKKNIVHGISAKLVSNWEQNMLHTKS